MDTPRPLLLAVLVSILVPGGLSQAAMLPAGEAGVQLPPFTAIYYPGGPTNRGGGHIALFTPEGPIAGTIQPRPVNVGHVAVDPRGPTYYGGGWPTYPVRIDPVTGAVTPLPSTNPEVSWPTGVTFDTTRNRLILSTLGGSGYLYSYSPEQDRWTTLSNLNNVDLYSVTYSAVDDRLYAISREGRLVWYDAQGRPAGSIRLDPTLPANLDLLRSQLVATGDRLVLLTQPVGDLLDPRLPAVQRSYLIDPDTGLLTALGPIRVVPEPWVGVVMCAGAVAAALMRRRPKAAVA